MIVAMYLRVVVRNDDFVTANDGTNRGAFGQWNVFDATPDHTTFPLRAMRNRFDGLGCAAT